MTSNALELLPGETYTVIFEYGFHASAVATSSAQGIPGLTRPGLGLTRPGLGGTTILTRGGSGPLTVGFKSNANGGIDASSPKETLAFNEGTLFTLDRSKKTRRVTFTFNSDNLASTTNGEFIIEGTIAADVKGAELLRESWQFLGSAQIKDIKLFRGNAEDANALHIPVEYIVKEYDAVADTERERHAIEQPSPPDQWFIKFGAGSTGTEFISAVADDTEGTLTTVDKLSRSLITNRMKLSTNTVYRMHVLINREDSDSGQPLRVEVTPSIKGLAGYTGTIASVSSQNSIVWEFNTSGITEANLSEVRFQIIAFEENIQPTEGGAIYISDINLLDISLYV